MRPTTSETHKRAFGIKEPPSSGESSPAPHSRNGKLYWQTLLSRVAMSDLQQHRNSYSCFFLFCVVLTCLPLYQTVKHSHEVQTLAVRITASRNSLAERCRSGMSGWIRFVQQIWVITGRALVHATSAQIIPLLCISCSKSVPAHFR